MSMFIEVFDEGKQCPVIINLETVMEIAPLKEGGCILYMSDGAGMNSRTSLTVKEGYDLFKQFAMHTITAEDIEKRFPKTPKKVRLEKDRHEIGFEDIPKL